MAHLRGAEILHWLTAHCDCSAVGSSRGRLEKTSEWNFLHFLTWFTEALILPRLQKYVSTILIHNRSCQIQLLLATRLAGLISLLNRWSWECHEFFLRDGRQQSTFQTMALERTVFLLCRFTHNECRHELTWAEFIIPTDGDRARCSSHSSFYYYSAFLGSADWTKFFIPVCILAELQSSNQLD